LGLLRSSNASSTSTAPATASRHASPDMYENIVLMGTLSDYPAWCCSREENRRGRPSTLYGSHSRCQSPLEFHFDPESNGSLDHGVASPNSVANMSSAGQSWMDGDDALHGHAGGETFQSTEDVKDALPSCQHSAYAKGTQATPVADVVHVRLLDLVQDTPATYRASSAQLSLSELIESSPAESGSSFGSLRKLCLVDFIEGEPVSSSTDDASDTSPPAVFEKPSGKGPEYPARWMRGKRGGARQRAERNEREMRGSRPH